MSVSGSGPGIIRVPAKTCIRPSTASARPSRDVAGIFDASTLGKIEVVGPDAAQFLNLIYTNSWDTLKPGRCRYGIMLREDGFVYDDGVVGRMAEDRFHVTTTTGGAARVMNHMEDYLQTEFPHLNVWLTSATEQWAVIAVQGPKAREIIAPLVEGIDLSNDAFPHAERSRKARSAACRPGCSACRSPVKPASKSTFPLISVQPSGRRFTNGPRALGGCAYGTEAMHILRAEKGYIIVGQDTDGTVTPDDASAWLGGRQEENRLCRHSRSAPSRSGRRWPQAACRSLDQRIRRWCWKRGRRSLPIRTSRCR